MVECIALIVIFIFILYHFKNMIFLTIKLQISIVKEKFRNYHAEKIIRRLESIK
jgi:hypothetical protein